MLIIDPSHEILAMHIDPALIELAGRTCYKSEGKGSCTDLPEDTAEDCLTANACGPHCPSHSSNKFIKMLLKRGHESVLEHSMLSVRFTTNRGVSHEIVRHRLAAFSQESTRYVSYGGKGCCFIRPLWLGTAVMGAWKGPLFEEEADRLMALGGSWADWLWLSHMDDCEQTYNILLHEQGWRPEQAREVLPNSTKTEIVVTANAREWRHIFKLRTAPAAHPEMRRSMVPLLEELKRSDASVLFEDILVKEAA